MWSRLYVLKGVLVLLSLDLLINTFMTHIMTHFIKISLCKNIYSQSGYADHIFVIEVLSVLCHHLGLYDLAELIINMIKSHYSVL